MKLNFKIILYVVIIGIVLYALFGINKTSPAKTPKEPLSKIVDKKFAELLSKLDPKNNRYSL